MDKIVFGIGNPGLQYAKTRHNIGFRVIDALAQKFSLNFRTSSFQADVAEGAIGETKFLLVKPITYVNLSGHCAQAILHWYKLSPTNLFVVSDDFNLPLGKIRIRSSGSSGGHHGLDSIIQCLQTLDFLRLRIGIGFNSTSQIIDFVLGKFNTDEEIVITPTILSARDAIVAWLDKQPLTKILNSYNTNSSQN